MQNLPARLAQIIRERGLTQKDIALEAKVDQSTVSRTLRDPRKRQSQAQKRLCIYAGIDAVSDGEEGTEKVVRAFRRIWDGSEVQAAAVANIIDALATLCAHVQSEKGGLVERQRESTADTPEKSGPE